MGFGIGPGLFFLWIEAGGGRFFVKGWFGGEEGVRGYFFIFRCFLVEWYHWGGRVEER